MVASRPTLICEQNNYIVDYYVSKYIEPRFARPEKMTPLAHPNEPIGPFASRPSGQEAKQPFALLKTLW